jgi:hypothetical protein
MNDNRIHYLEEVFEYTGRPIKILLKKEARDWLDKFLSDTRIVGALNEKYVIFGSIKNACQYKYFKYALTHSHVYFNNSYSLPVNLNICDMLEYSFNLSEEEIDDMLRSAIKKFLIKNDIIPSRKIKFFNKKDNYL